MKLVISVTSFSLSQTENTFFILRWNVRNINSFIFLEIKVFTNIFHNFFFILGTPLDNCLNNIYKHWD